jgi:hypothetical protein
VRITARVLDRIGPRRRRLFVTLHAERPTGHRWIIAPLVDAGLALEEIEVLLVRLGFEATVRGRDLDAFVHRLVDGQPVAVRAAWLETVSRLIAAHPT